MKSRSTVCGGCNNLVNSRVENPALAFFSFYRSVWGIGGRFGKIPPVPGEARFADGRLVPVELGPDGEIRRAVVSKEEHAGGKVVYFVCGPAGAAETAKASIDRARPGIRWEEGVPNPPRSIRVVLDGEADKLVLRQLAAKIAFERAAMLRSGEFMRDPDFDRARKFILDGVEPEPVCGLIGDPEVYKEPGQLAFGLSHHVVIVTTQQDVFGAVVVLFGLFYYWVALARPYRVLAQWDELTVQQPQSGKIETPTIRGGLGALQFPWKAWTRASTDNAEATCKAAFDLALTRLQRGVDDFYG